MSEAHQRQLLIFADNPDKFLDSYSKEFEEGFLTALRRTYGTKRVFANQVIITFKAVFDEKLRHHSMVTSILGKVQAVQNERVS